MLLDVLIFIFGLAILILSSHYLIQFSVKLSLLLKLTPFFIGVVLIAFGTSTPEAAVGIIAAIKNKEVIALGTVVGSNIANIGLILGLCSFIFPLLLKQKTILKREFPFMVFALFLLYVFSFDLFISRIEGVVFLVLFSLFCFFSYQSGKGDFKKEDLQHFKFNRFLSRQTNIFLILILSIFSIAGIVSGARLMVASGVSLAKKLGVSPGVISMTVFAIGTSLPELAASLSASFKKLSGVSLGNILGSNIFNTFFILGIVSLIEPIPVEESYLKFEFPIMIFFSFLLFTFLRRGYKISRKEGFILFFCYLIFIAILVGKQFI